MTALSHIIICMSLCLGGEPLAIAMHPAASASAEFVRLSDVASVAGPAGDVLLGRSPKEGELVTITRGFVAARLEQEGFAVGAFLGPEETTVAARPMSAAKIESAVREAISRDIGRETESLAVKVLSVAPIHDSGTAKDNAAAARREIGCPLGRSVYSVATDEGNLHALLHVSESSSALVDRPHAAIGRGMRVRVDVGAGALRISTDAIALESGGIGETIALRNPRSGRDFSARVTGPGTATPE